MTDTASPFPDQQIITDDLDLLLEALPPRIVDALQGAERRNELLEVVMDLGRLPEARYPGREVVLSHDEVGEDDLQFVIDHIGDFGDDNRAGIERTLHRISCIRNRRGKIVGLTCRVGRAVYGTIDIIKDLIESGQSILMMGAPGVGKTTMEIAVGERGFVRLVDRRCSHTGRASRSLPRDALSHPTTSSLVCSTGAACPDEGG